MIGIIQDITSYKIIENDLKVLGETLNEDQKVSGVGSWKYDVLKDEFYGSDEMYRIYGIDPKDFKKDFRSTLKLIHPEDQIKIQNATMMNLSGRDSQIEYRIPQPDGSNKYVVSKGEPIFNAAQEVIGVLGTLQDITENKILQEKVNKIQRIFQVLVQGSSDVYAIITPDGIIKYISPAVEKVLGYKPEEVIDKKVYEFLEEEEKTKLSQMLTLVLSGSDKIVRGDITLKTEEGKEIFLELNLKNQLLEPSIQGIVINSRDITSRIEMEQEMMYISTHDELTNLPNRAYLKKYLKEKCELGKENQSFFTVMMLDIHDFKYVNNALGYKLGDKLIIEITKRLKNLLGDKSFICRYSGVQFFIIEEGLNSIEEYDKIARNIIDLFSKPFKVDKYELYITMNMGISIYPEDGQDRDSLAKSANLALFRSKNEGKNQYKFYSANIDFLSYKQFELRNDLRKAIEENQFKVYYQPQINIKSSEILGAEALIRWEHPTWGLVPPGEFIPLAEETGLIINLGKWMLREVCRTYKEWLENGLPAIKVSINYSAIQFFEENFIENTKNVIDEFGLDPHFLIMEITESILIDNSKEMMSIIKNLKDFRIQIALDDFGTGYSSLAYLNSLNIDILKIDRSFIKNVVLDETSTIITTYVIDLARKLRIKLVAEGVETWEQLSFLRKLNCYTGQGYIYSKPIPKQEFEALLRKKKCKPVRVNDTKTELREERRKFFRIHFYESLEADMTILEIQGKRIKIGTTKVLIKNMGPGGLCFISNVRIPIKRDVILQFTSQLLGGDIKVQGCPVWREEVDDNLHEHGIEFTFDEKSREDLIKVLNQVQIKMRNNIGFAEGNFISDSPLRYFSI